MTCSHRPAEEGSRNRSMEEQRDVSEESHRRHEPRQRMAKGRQAFAWPEEKWRCRSIIHSFSCRDSPVFATGHGLGFWQVGSGRYVKACSLLSRRCHWRAYRLALAWCDGCWPTRSTSILSLATHHYCITASHSQRTPAGLQLTSTALHTVRPPVTFARAKYQSLPPQLLACPWCPSPLEPQDKQQAFAVSHAIRPATPVRYRHRV